MRHAYTDLPLRFAGCLVDGLRCAVIFAQHVFAVIVEGASDFRHPESIDCPLQQPAPRAALQRRYMPAELRFRHVQHPPGGGKAVVADHCGKIDEIVQILENDPLRSAPGHLFQ